MANNGSGLCPQCGVRHNGSADEPCAACLLRLGLTASDETTLAAPPEDEGAPHPTPDRIGDWKPLRLLGEGGMGVVYLAQELGPLKRQGALKQIKHGLDSRRVLERFNQERRVLARMDHPGIARAIDAGTAADGSPFFVMEYVNGTPITEYCDRKRLGSSQRLELFARLCDAVDHAHRRGILHRDLKPSNILVVDDLSGPQPKVIDFGVARAIAQQRLEWSVFTEFGRLVGTPEYMSPEQADLENDDLDTRSDVYGLGVVLYELLVGKTPYEPKELRKLGLQALLKTIREGSFPTPSSRLSTLGDEAGAIAENRGSDPGRLLRGIAGELDWIVMRATERDRERRYGSPRELGEDIRRFLNNDPVVAGPPGALYRVRKFVRRHRLGVSVAATGLAGLLLFAATMAWQAKTIARERDRARQEAEISERISQLLVGVFESADPYAAVADETLSARQVLVLGMEQARRTLKDQPEIRARLYDALGRSFAGIGDPDRAETLFVEAREAYLQLGEGYEEQAADAVYQLARLAWRGGGTESATKLYEQAIRMEQMRLGIHHRKPLRIEIEIAEMYSLQGDFDTAMTRLDSLRPRLAQHLGDSDPDTLAASALTAFVLAHSGEWEAAGKYVDAAVSGMTLPREAYSPWDTHQMQRLAWICIMLNRFEDAESVSTELAEYREEFLGPDHPLTIDAREQMAEIYYNQGLYAEAAGVREVALTRRRAVLGEFHSLTMITLGRLADSYYHSQRYLEAEESFRELLTAWEPDESNAFHRFRCTFGLANTLMRLDRPEEALPLYEEAEAYCEAKLSERFPICRENTEYLAEARASVKR